MPIVLKSGSLYLLQPSGPVQAYNGIALPLPTHIFMTGIYNGDIVSCEVRAEDEETSDYLKITTETDGVLCKVRGNSNKRLTI